MSKIKCRHCGKEFNDTRGICPICGTTPPPPIPGKTKTIFIILISLFIVIILLARVSGYYKDSEILKQDYARLCQSYEAGHTNLFISQLTLLRDAGKFNYKNIPQMSKNVESKLSHNISMLSGGDLLENLKLYKQLVRLDPENMEYPVKVAFYQAKIERQAREKEQELKRRKDRELAIKKEAERQKASLDRVEYLQVLKQQKIYPALVAKIEGGCVEDEVIITVTNPWHYQPYQVRLQAAQGLWERWATVHSPSHPDHSKIKIVDFRGNKVGGSGWIFGSSIKVKE